MGFLHNMKKKTKKIASKAPLSIGKVGVTFGKGLTVGGKVLQTAGTVMDDLTGVDVIKKLGKSTSQYGKMTTLAGRASREGARGHKDREHHQLEKAKKKGMNFLKSVRKIK